MGVDISAGYSVDLSTGQGYFTAGGNANVNIFGGLDYNYGGNWDSLSNQVKWGGDFSYNAGHNFEQIGKDARAVGDAWNNFFNPPRYGLLAMGYLQEMPEYKEATYQNLNEKQLIDMTPKEAVHYLEQRESELPSKINSEISGAMRNSEVAKPVTNVIKKEAIRVIIQQKIKNIIKGLNKLETKLG